MRDSTAVVLKLGPDHIADAGVGDSGGWIINHDQIDDLTEQERL